MGHLHPPPKPKLVCTKYNGIFVFYTLSLILADLFRQKYQTAPPKPNFPKNLQSQNVSGEKLRKALSYKKKQMVVKSTTGGIAAHRMLMILTPSLFYIDQTERAEMLLFHTSPKMFWVIDHATTFDTFRANFYFETRS